MAQLCGSIRSAMCSMLIGHLDKGLDFLNKAQRLLTPLLDTIKLDIGSINLDLSKLSDMRDAIDGYVLPDFSIDCLSMLADTIANCSYLSNNSLLNEVSGLVNTLDSWLKLDLKNAIIGDLDIPEVNIALNIDLSFNTCLDLKLDSLVPDMGNMINCVNALCSGNDISSRISSMNTLLGNMNLTSSGTLDIGGILSDAGTSSEEAEAFTNTFNALNTKKTAITSAVVAGVETATTQTISTTGAKYFGATIGGCGLCDGLLAVQLIECSSTSSTTSNTNGTLSPAAISNTSVIANLAVEGLITSTSSSICSVLGNLNVV